MTPWLRRKLAETCAEYGCPNPPLDDNCRCEGCRDRHRERQARSKRERYWRDKAQLQLDWRNA